METRNRNVWIVVGIVAAVAVLCCCIVVLAAAVTSWQFGFPGGLSWGPGVDGGEIDRTYDVGLAPQLTIDSFAGSIVVRAGEGSQIRVMATRHAPSASDLESVEVDIQPREGGFAVVTRNPRLLMNAWVRLELVVPVGTSFDVRTSSGGVELSGLRGGGKAETSSGRVTARNMIGTVSLHTSSGGMSVYGFEGDLQVHVSSGSIEVDSMDGNLDAHTSSGGIDVRGAQGWVQLETSSGTIDYQGVPVGDCRFKTGSGSIELRLPPDLDAQVDLHTNSGSVKVGFPVEGGGTRQTVTGVIGSGGDASIYARTGSGGISLSQY
ncbi:MAG: DUF4097 family beta strand repeat-containing protein [Anaerolineae bacterium]|jgi:hypothetical protein